MKKLIFLILIISLLFSACARMNEKEPELPDSPSADNSEIDSSDSLPNLPEDSATSDDKEEDNPDQTDTPDNPDYQEPPTSNTTPDTDNEVKPTEPDTPPSAGDTDNPADTDTPPEADVPPQTDNSPAESQNPEYPDISGFDTTNRKIVYAAAEVSLLTGNGNIAFTLSQDHALISLGTADKYTVIFYKDSRYLADSELITSTRPASYTEKESTLGGIYYKGGDKLVAIDAGHQNKGMYDKEPVGPGSDTLKTMVAAGTEGIYTKIPEYVLNLNVSLLLRDELICRGYSVVMIRETHDVRISNAQRAQIANAYNADAFIRIHANGSDNQNVRGALAMFQTKDNPWCGNLYTQSRLLSETVLAAYCSATDIENDGNYETDTMTGINWTTVPATIIELGYMSNAEEDKLMSTSYFHKTAAIGIAKGIDNYFEKVEQ